MHSAASPLDAPTCCRHSGFAAGGCVARCRWHDGLSSQIAPKTKPNITAAGASGSLGCLSPSVFHADETSYVGNMFQTAVRSVQHSPFTCTHRACRIWDAGDAWEHDKANMAIGKQLGSSRSLSPASTCGNSRKVPPLLFPFAHIAVRLIIQLKNSCSRSRFAVAASC